MRSFSSGAPFYRVTDLFIPSLLLRLVPRSLFLFFTVSLYRAFFIYFFLCFATSMFLLSISGWNLNGEVLDQ